MDTDSKGQRLISVVRVLEYRGTEEWLVKVLQASRLPSQGVVRHSADPPHAPFPEGCEIKSGLVVWDIMDETGQERQPNVIPIPPGSKVN